MWTPCARAFGQNTAAWKALPRDEATAKQLLHIFATQGLTSALQIPPENTAMLHRARDLRADFVQPLNDSVRWED
jgi:hypothetical protein